MIYGAMGSERRMDFTVIGDVVNTGARLCGTACGGEVLVTASVRDALGVLEDVEVLEHAPLSVKGKREAVAVWELRARG